MAIDFNKLRLQTPEEKRLREHRLRLRMAELSLENARHTTRNTPNFCVYTALSHLAEVPELNINLGSFDALQYQYDLPFDTDAYLLAKKKMKELQNIILSE